MTETERGTMTMDELFFFDGKPEELALYEALLDRIRLAYEFGNRIQ